MSDEPGAIRLQKVLAAAGVGSRRACEQLIEEGRVEVDGVMVREQGLRVDPAKAVVKVDGERVVVNNTTVVLAMNKPRGVLTAMYDDQDRPCVGDYVRNRHDRLFHVGRLDADTEGLLILTNDGELANRLGHPKYAIPKTYLATVIGTARREDLVSLRAGVELDDGLSRFDKVRIIQKAEDRTLLEIVLHSGRNRVVRRTLEAVGLPVQDLVRVTVGPLRLGQQRSGSLRPLTRKELGALYFSVGM